MKLEKSQSLTMSFCKDLLGVLCACTSIGTFITGIVLSIVDDPVPLSILWGVWVVSTAAYPLGFPSSIDPPFPKIPLKSTLIQHPDDTVSIHVK